MKNKILTLALIVAMANTGFFALAQDYDHIDMEGGTPQVQHVGNKICPVTGSEVGSMGDVVTVDYKGKVYNLCCPGCINTFNADPEKYAQIAEENAGFVPAVTPDEPSEDMQDMKGIKEDQSMDTSMDTSMEEMDHSQGNHDLTSAMPADGEIRYYTCGMHPSVKVSVESYNNGDTKCPICFMPLTPVNQNGDLEGDFGEDVISKVIIKAEELKLAGVETEPAKKRQLFKEIRAVGKVAYDPQLAVAQDEFISSVKSFEKAQQGGVQEITDRAASLIESSKRKLELLGLSKGQITGLEETKQVQRNLILPGKKMWVYGDVYEYELNWIKPGAYVTVKPTGFTGKEYYGEVVSINPVVDSQTRSVRFRALIDTADETLKPEMYVDIEIMSPYTDAEGHTEALSMPKNALLDTGRRTIVWVDTGKGSFEGRHVVVGPEAIDHSENPQKYYPILKGVHEGEKVVVKGNFLIDSQSQITGIASSAYGGAIGEENKSMPMPMGHNH